MTLISGGQTTYLTKGIREELSDFIYNVSPAETPVISNSGSESIGNTFFEWQLDALAAAAANQQLEGDDVTASAVTATTRYGNYAQISYKSFAVTGTDEVVRKAGRASEVGYQTAKRGLELKRDMEFAVTGLNAIAVAGNGTTARVTAGLPLFLQTNTSFGAGGANPTITTFPSTARTNGTQRPLTEALLKTVLQSTFNSGGNPTSLVCGPVQKQEISAFGGVATKSYVMTQERTAAIVGAADIYISDFSTLTIIPSRFIRVVSTVTQDVWALDWNLLSIAYLRPFMQTPLAKTGDSERRLLLVEFGLKVKNEAGLGLVTDVT